MKGNKSTPDLAKPGSKSPYFSIPPMIKSTSTRPQTAGMKKKISAQERITQLESQVDTLIKSKWSMEDVHSCVIKRMHEEIVRLGGKRELVGLSNNINNNVSESHNGHKKDSPVKSNVKSSKKTLLEPITLQTKIESSPPQVPPIVEKKTELHETFTMDSARRLMRVNSVAVNSLSFSSSGSFYDIDNDSLLDEADNVLNGLLTYAETPELEPNRRQSVGYQVQKMQQKYNWESKHLALLRATIAITLQSSYEKLFERFFKGLKMVTGATHVVTYFVDSKNNLLKEVYIKDKTFFQKPGIKPSGLVGQVVETCQALFIEDVSIYESYDVGIDGHEGKNPGHMIITLIYDDQGAPYAVVKLFHEENSKNVFTDEDFSLIDTLSFVAYNSIKRSEMFEDVNSAQARTNAALEISRAVSSEVETASIIPKIIKVAKDVLKADKVSVFLINKRNPQELIIESSEDVCGVVIPISAGIAGAVATSGTTVNLRDAYDDERFNQYMDKKSGYRTRQILCMAIPDNEKRTIGVIQAINKAGDTAFTPEDENMLQYVCENAGMTLMKSRLLEEANKERKKNKALRDVVKCVSESKRMTLDQLIRSLVDVAYHMIEVDRITLFMKDEISNELVCRVSKDDVEGFRVSLGKGIAGTVAATGVAINISDAYNDARFDTGLDRATGYKTRSLLCSPIKDTSDRIVGVIQLINKQNGREFNAEDEELLGAFTLEVAEVMKVKSLEASMNDVLEGKNRKNSIHNSDGLSSLLQQYKYTDQKNTTDSDKLLHTPVATPRELEAVKVNFAKILDLGFNVLDCNEEELTALLPHFFGYFSLIETFKIPTKKMTKFFTAIQGGYSGKNPGISGGPNVNPYHNYFHGVGVLHIVFFFLAKGGCSDYFEPIDMLSALLAGLCHDVDHPGTNNAFEVNSRSPLAILYNDQSVLEHHHSAYSSQLLNDPNFNFLESISFADHQRFRKLFVEAILATDMSHHFEHITELKSLDHPINKSNAKDRTLLANTIMHCADLSNPVLPNFQVVKRWAVLVCEEFSEQVRKEKELKLPFAPHMDNLDKPKAISKLQVGFIDYVVSPLWVTVGDILPKMKECIDNLKANREQWCLEVAS